MRIFKHSELLSLGFADAPPLLMIPDGRDPLSGRVARSSTSFSTAPTLSSTASPLSLTHHQGALFSRQFSLLNFQDRVENQNVVAVVKNSG